MDRHQKAAVKKCGGRPVLKAATAKARKIDKSARFFWAQPDQMQRGWKARVWLAHGPTYNEPGGGRIGGEGIAASEEQALEIAKEQAQKLNHPYGIKGGSQTWPFQIPSTVIFIFTVDEGLPIIIEVKNVKFDFDKGESNFTDVTMVAIREPIVNLGLPITSAGRFM